MQNATEDLVAEKIFHHAVLTRLRQWELPADLKALAQKIGKKASTTKRERGGAGMNGLALDHRGKASLESLVLHYAKRAPGLFPQEYIKAVSEKFAAYNGPKFQGPWP